MDYFNGAAPAAQGAGASAGQNNGPTPNNTAASRRPIGLPSFESLRAPSTIRIRRLPSSQGSFTRPATREAETRPPSTEPEPEEPTGGRRRSMSAPQRYRSDVLHTVNDPSRLDPHMPAINEGLPSTPGLSDISRTTTRQRGFSNRMTRFRSNTSTSRIPRREDPHHDEYDSDVIDLLDLIDPEVRTIGTLTNLQNSLFVPDLGSLVNRRPTYDLTTRHERMSLLSSKGDEDRKYRSRSGTQASRMSERPRRAETASLERVEMEDLPSSSEGPQRRLSIGSDLSDSRYAVLPHGVSLEGWSDDEIEELNDHVRHLLHSRREGFKRSWKGFKKYISRPLGLFVFFYATSVTLFGTAWVFALIGWIYVGNEERQGYIIDVIDNVLVAFFALMGDGLAPFRAVDTYHMCFIAHYHHLTWRLRQEKQLPELVDHNDLPDRHPSSDAATLEDTVVADMDKGTEEDPALAEYSVLTARQQKRLQYHQAKFSKSHTFYKPHETSTHHAFPLRLLVTVVVLLDFHSIFQVALGTCTWSIDYRVRPQALTATILACSLTCNIVAGILISVGDHRTRKKDVLERMFRQALTEEALKRMARSRARGDITLTVHPSQLQEGEISEAVEAVTGKELAQAKAKSAPNVLKTVDGAAAAKDSSDSSDDASPVVAASPESPSPPAGVEATQHQSAAALPKLQASVSAPDIPTSKSRHHQQQSIPMIKETKPSVDIDRATFDFGDDEKKGMDVAP